jgi:hypothetical protein
VAQAFGYQTHQINQIQVHGTTARRLRLGRKLQVPGNWPVWGWAGELSGRAVDLICCSVGSFGLRSISGEEMERTRRSSSAFFHLQGLGQSAKYRGSNQSVFGADDADLVLEWEQNSEYYAL